jgi:hypothetical protein
LKKLKYSCQPLAVSYQQKCGNYCLQQDASRTGHLRYDNESNNHRYADTEKE